MEIRGKDVYMTRGDTEVLTVTCPAKPFTQGDLLELTVREAAGYGPPLIHKSVTEFTNGAALVRFAPTDTSGMKFGTYSYDVQVTYQDIGVKTIIKPHDFVIGKENTYDY